MKNFTSPHAALLSRSLAFALLMIVFSCMPEDALVAPSSSDQPSSSPKITMSRLGRQLENPYSIANMQHALDTMRSQLAAYASSTSELAFQKLAERVVLNTTDLYVRFLPQDTAEMRLLEADTTLELYGYPLDYAIEEQGDYYRDSSVPAGGYPWQYAVVKPGYEFPAIKRKVLAELFIPEHSVQYSRSEALAKNYRESYTMTRMLNKLETVSLYLTDNLPEDEKEQLKVLQQSDPRARRVCIWFVCWNEPDWWSPSGRIKVVNTNKEGRMDGGGSDPVRKVRVRIRRWFTVKTTYTNYYGDYIFWNAFRRPANYSLVFANGDVSVKASWFAGVFSSARYNGPKRRGRWDITFWYNSVGWLWSSIMNGVYDYKYRQAPGHGVLPPLFLRIVANQGKGSSYCHMLGYAISTNSAASYLNDIRIFKSGQDSENIYGTMMHELGHASHQRLVGNEIYINHLGWNYIVNSFASPTAVLESWGSSTEYVFTRSVYPSYSSDYFIQSQEIKHWRGKRGYISAIVYDVWDTYDQSTKNTPNKKYPRDRVSGYSIGNLYYALAGAVNMRQWRNNLYNNHPNNPTRRYLAEYFQNYANDW